MAVMISTHSYLNGELKFRVNGSTVPSLPSGYTGIVATLGLYDPIQFSSINLLTDSWENHGQTFIGNWDSIINLYSLNDYTTSIFSNLTGTKTVYLSVWYVKSETLPSGATSYASATLHDYATMTVNFGSGSGGGSSGDDDDWENDETYKWYDITESNIVYSSSFDMDYELLSNEVGYVRFRPTIDGELIVYTVANRDSYGYLGLYGEMEIDSAGNVVGSVLEENDDNDEDYNFIIRYNVNAGTHYQIAFHDLGHNSNMSGTLYVEFIPEITNYTITYKLGIADRWSDGTTNDKTQTKPANSSVSLYGAIGRQDSTSTTSDNTYTFNGNGATTQSKQQETSDIIRSYTHTSWNTRAGGPGTSYDLNAIYSENSNITLYPRLDTTVSYTEIHFPTADECKKTNHTLLGWSSSSNATSATYSPGAALAGNHTTKTWYAVWQANTYTITYDGNGIDAFDSTATYTINDTITWANPSITKEYTYIEIDADKNETSEIKSQSFSVYTWNTSANGTGTSYKPGETISGADLNSNITLFAQYRRVVVLPPVRVPGVPLISTFSTIHYDKDNNIMPNISTVPLSYKRVKTIVTKKRLVYYNWQDEDETHPYYKSLELNPPWAGINVTIPSGLPHPIDWNNVNKYCGTKQMNEFISLINKYTGSSISLLNTDDIITKSLYNQIANILNNVSDVDDKNIHCHDYDFEEANLSLLDDDTPLRKTHFTNLSHALLYLRYWEKD